MFVAYSPGLAKLDATSAVDCDNILYDGVDGGRKASPRGHGGNAEGHLEFMRPDRGYEKGEAEDDHEAGERHGDYMHGCGVPGVDKHWREKGRMPNGETYREEPTTRGAKNAVIAILI